MPVPPLSLSILCALLSALHSFLLVIIAVCLLSAKHARYYIILTLSISVCLLLCFSPAACKLQPYQAQASALPNSNERISLFHQLFVIFNVYPSFFISVYLSLCFFLHYFSVPSGVDLQCTQIIPLSVAPWSLSVCISLHSLCVICRTLISIYLSTFVLSHLLHSFSPSYRLQTANFSSSSVSSFKLE